MKLPAFQFYPADWRKDPGVQSLSFHDRGVWFEILCLMHESGERGKLTLSGQAMPEDALARLLGLDKQNLTKTLTTILTYGVASRCPDTGALVCRRMIRDEDLRQKRKAAGEKGGNPTLTGKKPKVLLKQKVKQIPTPSSSSSSSEYSPIVPKGTEDREPEFPLVLEQRPSSPLPDRWRNIPRIDRKNHKVAFNTQEMERIGSWFGRKPGTLWTLAEGIALLESIKPSHEDVGVLERYYLAEIPKRNDYRRRDLMTLLNNWSSELDRAHLWIVESDD
jgi:hypothetical protein